MSAYQTKQEVDKAIAELQEIRGMLPDEQGERQAGLDWLFYPSNSTVYLERLSSSKQSQRRILSIDKDGVLLWPGSGGYLDGIARDSGGNIRVHGHVNAAELKERIKAVRPHRESLHGMLWDIIDELAGIKS